MQQGGKKMQIVVRKSEILALRAIFLIALVSAVGHTVSYFKLEELAPSIGVPPDFSGKDPSKIAVESNEYSKKMALASIQLVTVSALRDRAVNSAIWSTLLATFCGYILLRVKK
jgi:hypothetical protein